MEQQFDIDVNLVLSTLAGGGEILVDSGIDASREQGFRLIQSMIHVDYTGKTTAEGPIIYGLCCNLADAGALGAILESDPQGRTTQDIARAKGVYVKILGKISLASTATGSTGQVVQPIQVNYGKNGWSIPEGSKLAYWARNNDGSALTTGTIITFDAEHFGVWLRD